MVSGEFRWFGSDLHRFQEAFKKVSGMFQRDFNAFQSVSKRVRGFHGGYEDFQR